jgi:hypothetical protein
VDHYRQCLAIGQQLGRDLAMTVANIAQAHIRLGDDAEARRLLGEALVAARRWGNASTLLFCVLTEADRRLVHGDVSAGLALIDSVRSHPAHTDHLEGEIERILARVGLPPDAGQIAADGGGRDFDVVIDDLVDELTTGAAAP